MDCKYQKECEVCGEPATTGVRDILQQDNFMSGCVDNEPDGAMHFYCDAHKRNSSIRIGAKNIPNISQY